MFTINNIQCLDYFFSFFALNKIKCCRHRLAADNSREPKVPFCSVPLRELNRVGGLLDQKTFWVCSTTFFWSTLEGEQCFFRGDPYDAFPCGCENDGKKGSSNAAEESEELRDREDEREEEREGRE